MRPRYGRMHESVQEIKSITSASGVAAQLWPFDTETLRHIQGGHRSVFTGDVEPAPGTVREARGCRESAGLAKGLDPATRIDNAHTAIEVLGDEQRHPSPLADEREAGRAAQAGGHRRPGVAASAELAVPRHGRDDTCFRIDDANAVVTHVGDVDVAVRCERHVGRSIEMCRRCGSAVSNRVGLDRDGRRPRWCRIRPVACVMTRTR